MLELVARVLEGIIDLIDKIGTRRAFPSVLLESELFCQKRSNACFIGYAQ